MNTAPSERPPLLYLCHRAPLRPDKGERMRSVGHLTGLTAHYEVHLGGFVDEEPDRRALAELEEQCASLFLVPTPRWALLRHARSLRRRHPLSIGWFDDASLRDWVRDTVDRHRIDHALAVSAAVAPYMLDLPIGHRVVDLVDVDSAKWGTYATRRSRLTRPLHRREARLVARVEAAISSAATDVVLVSDAEAAEFVDRRGHDGDPGARVATVPLGFRLPGDAGPVSAADAAATVASDRIVFTGTMSYWPNVVAVRWFADEVLPLVRRRVPTATFVIVGRDPGRSVLRLGRRPGVMVTGSVPDVGVHLSSAAVVVAPMQFSHGVPSKIVEAMAHGRRLVATSHALVGFDPAPPAVAADHPVDFADAVVAALTTVDTDFADTARAWVRTHQNAAASTAALLAVLGRGTRPASSRTDRGGE